MGPPSVHVDGREPFETRDEAERRHFKRALKYCNWNISLAADILGIDRRQLQRTIDRLGLTRPDLDDPET